MAQIPFNIILLLAQFLYNVFSYSIVSINDVRITNSRHFFIQKTRPAIASFTLLELVLVLVLVSILAVTTIPKFFDALSFTANNYFTVVLNSIRYAQKLAIASGCDVQIQATNNSITLLRRNACRTGDFNQIIAEPITGQAFIKYAPTGVQLANLGFPIYFTRSGKAYNNSAQLLNATLIVANRTITIVAETGLVYEP